MALRLSNYFIHPSDNRYLVFVYQKEMYANHFEEQLVANSIEFERHYDEDENEILFGVHKRYQKVAIRSNFLTHAAYRRPFIKNKVVKITMLIITLSIIILGFVGYLRTP